MKRLIVWIGVVMIPLFAWSAAPGLVGLGLGLALVAIHAFLIFSKASDKVKAAVIFGLLGISSVGTFALGNVALVSAGLVIIFANAATISAKAAKGQ